MSSLLARWASVALLVLGLAAPASATWSIVIVDRRTLEIGVGCATCITDFPIRRGVPVMVVGKGAAAAQASIDGDGSNRQVIFQMLAEGASPADVLAALEAGDFEHQTRQYGIASLVHGTGATFTGVSTLAWAGGVVGEVGDWVYAIQGNILVGPSTVAEAEAALVNTPGDMSQRLLAAMVAARNTGGDARCNCAPSCGVPPPQPFVSSWTAFMGIARLGDVDGTCDSSGCAEGTYYLKRQVVGLFGDPDPVDIMEIRIANWRNSLVGRPDHMLSVVSSPTDDVPVADGGYLKAYEVRLVDVDGVPLTSGGATVTVTPAEGSVPFSTTQVLDLGNGTYQFGLVAGTLPGVARLEVVVDDGVSPVTLAPFHEVEFTPAAALSRSPAAVPAAAGGRVDFAVAMPTRPNAPFVLLGSASGSAPGIQLGGTVLPLNPDAAFTCTLLEANGPLLPGSFGFLDEAGEARPAFVAPPGLLATLAGQELTFAALLFQPYAATTVVSVQVAP